MAMLADLVLADLVDVVIGVDTHKHTHTAAVVAAATGGVVAQQTVAVDASGYQALYALAQQHSQQPGRRVWALEGTGSYGAGLARMLAAHGEQVVEVDCPKRPARRHGAKSGALDAVARLVRPWPAPAWPAPAWPGLGRQASARRWRCCCRLGARRCRPLAMPSVSCMPC
jgi:transposase